MSIDEFNKQQYITLREEIRTCKARVFFLLVLGTLFIPAAAFAAKEFGATFASAGTPFILLVLMLAFLMEQNAIVRAGKYLREHVEPKLQDNVTWESWLESNRKLREMDRYFFATFLLVFTMFYVLLSGMAIDALANDFPQTYIYYGTAGYGVGGVWFLIVWLGHWRTCTSTS